MNQEQFIIMLECYQTSYVPFYVKKQAIQRLKAQFLNSNIKEKTTHTASSVSQPSVQLKFKEVFL